MNQPPRTEAELIELVRSSDVRAPEALHRRIEELVAERSASRRRPAILGGAFGAGGTALGRRIGAVAALAAVAVAVLVIALGSGGGGALTVQRATALTLGSPKAPAPRESSPSSGQLVAAVQGVHFPYWEERFGWRSTGQRTDEVAGHAVMTVFYANGGGQRIGYAIVAGTPPRLSGGSVKWRAGEPYRLFAEQGAQTVAWLRRGRLCVLSGRGVDPATLIRLASWGKPGSAA
jgi:hypothetical protein